MAYIVIDEKKCKSCYFCVEACPKKLIRVGKNVGKTGNCTVEFDDKNGECIGCKSCAVSCPDLAITEVYR